ncbi:MAG: metal-sulfur cluster assembly factor [Candidatus Micrarchaeia archaeon]
MVPAEKKAGSGITESKLRDALRSVIDPELGVNVVDLGLIYDININRDAVKIKMTLTTPMCPLAPVIIEGVQKAAEGVEGVKKVDVEVTFDPPWSIDRVSPGLREKMGLGV